MRHGAKAEAPAELGEVVQQLGEAAVVGLEEGLERQQGEQLVLGVVLAGELRGVGGQRLPRQPQRLPGHGTRRLGHRSRGLHTPLYAAQPEGLNRALRRLNVSPECGEAQG